MTTIKHMDILLTVLSVLGIIFTIWSMAKAPAKRRIMYVTPIIWFAINVGLYIYCIHCPDRGNLSKHPVKVILDSVTRILGFISYVSTAYVCHVSTMRECPRYDELKEALDELDN